MRDIEEQNGLVPSGLKLSWVDIQTTDATDLQKLLCPILEPVSSLDPADFELQWIALDVQAAYTRVKSRKEGPRRPSTPTIEVV